MDFRVFVRHLRKIPKKRLLASSCLSVHSSARNKMAPNGRIFMTFYVWVFFLTPSRKCKFNSNPTRITGTSHEDPYTYYDISLSTSYNEKCERKKLRRKWKHTFYTKYFFFSENRAVFRWCGETYCTFWVAKATDTNSLYVTLTPFPQKNMIRRTVLIVTS